MADITVTIEEFQKKFPEFANDNKDVLETYLEQAQCYITTKNYGALRNKCRELAIYLMVAHLYTLQKDIENGKTQLTLVSATTIDKVSITLVPPQNKDSFDAWCNATIYGSRLLGLLVSRYPAGYYFGGSRQRVFR